VHAAPFQLALRHVFGTTRAAPHAARSAWGRDDLSEASERAHGQAPISTLDQHVARRRMWRPVPDEPARHDSSSRCPPARQGSYRLSAFDIDRTGHGTDSGRPFSAGLRLPPMRRKHTAEAEHLVTSWRDTHQVSRLRRSPAFSALVLAARPRMVVCPAAALRVWARVSDDQDTSNQLAEVHQWLGGAALEICAHYVLGGRRRS
jgi:hypothetical protein